ncbi:MAG TPA: hypothetical protein VN420_03580 [Candidatus Fimivivens sp.]|nr:hypothetical protein [Candidatus Fimivivens sp.]
MVLNELLDKFLAATLWIWLPFYVLPDLLRDARERFRKIRAKKRA